jgi:hypothetical protein
MKNPYRDKFLNEYGIDHTVIKVDDTPKMAEIARQIAVLQDQYDTRKTIEQKREFEKYKAKLREVAISTRLGRSYGY